MGRLPRRGLAPRHPRRRGPDPHRRARRKGSQGRREIVTATEGNCGRAVARMAKYMGLTARVWVPGFMNEETRELIRGEDAEVVVHEGSYDDLIPIVSEEGEDRNTILIFDVSFEGYHDIPKVRGWILRRVIMKATETR